MASMYAEGDLYVDVERNPDGGVAITAQDLRGAFGGSEYEYGFTVAPGDVPKLVEALGGRPGDDPVALLVEHGREIVSQGESQWLEAAGVTAEFWNWVNFD